MTRETRIGMLVGLVFIVMFGLVVTELSGPDDGDPAAMAGPRADVIWRPTIEEISPVIAAGDTPPRRDIAPIRHDETLYDGSVPAMLAQGRPARPRTAEHTVRPPASSVDPPRMGSEAVLAARTIAPEPIPPAVESVDVPLAAPAEPAARRTYTVRSGDTLIRIARRVYGPDHEQAYRRIYQANRDKMRSPSHLLAGTVLTIPPLNGAGQSAAAAQVAGRRPPAEEMDLKQLAARFDSSWRSRSSSRARQYTVARGDTLTRIARKTLGEGSHQAAMRIYRVNRETLSSPDVLPVGATLTIPD